ncbi:MAG: VPLPA-CTERM sorting domain-containing protein [Halioglobus sp.]
MDGNKNETFIFEALIENSVVDTFSILGTDATLDGQVDKISFGGLFDEVRITGTTTGGSRNIGWGIDNIQTTVVPLPAAAWLFGSAVLGLGAIKRKRS